jgi:transcriptional regulator with XRE-family HTH domain
MISFLMPTPFEIKESIVQRAKAKRLFLNLSQRTLSERSGVSLGTLKKFERSGQISLESLLKLALALRALEEFSALFREKKIEQYLSLDEILKEKKRKRGRK